MQTKLLIAIMYSNKELLNKAVGELTNLFGEIADKSNEYDFTKFTNYYNDEMGDIIKKRFLVFKKPIKKEELPKIKLQTTEIENRYSIKERMINDKTSNNITTKRQINLDPGYLTDSELVLATFKNKPFKTKIAEGIYAHKVLEFKDNKAIHFFHTFKDYKEKENQEFFLKCD